LSPGLQQENQRRIEKGVALLFRRSISVGVPTAAFKLEGAGAHDLFGLFFTAARALMGFGSHGNQFFEKMTALAFEFINRHGLNLQNFSFAELENLALI
jgi:hypothetical protein